jgi:GR25 family glycosyltransferase involved in LPS biosynthesis
MDAFIDPATIVVINLDHSVQTLEAFRGRNAHLGPVRRFPAVLGADLDRAFLRASGVISGDVNYSDGALGCALSHFALWGEIAEGNRPITVCEDDAVFAADFTAIGNARIAALPDGWDIVLWGWNFDGWMVFQALPGGPACLVHNDRFLTAEDFAAASGTAASPRLFRLDYACGTLCYTISPQGAARMLDYCRPIRPLSVLLPEARAKLPNLGVDLMMSSTYSRTQSYVSVPPLVISPNLKANSTTFAMDSVGLRRKITRLPLMTLVGALQQDGTFTDPRIKASFYKTWIDGNDTSRLLFAAWFNLGCELARARDLDNAMAAFGNALVLNPDFEPASTNLGLLASGFVAAPASSP